MKPIQFRYTLQQAKRLYAFPVGEGMQPTRATDAAIDLRSMQNAVVMPGECVKVPSGLAIDILPEHQCAAVVLPRSGTGTRGLILGNTVGLIDAGYQGDISLTLWNRGDEPFQVNEGDRVAQLLILPILSPMFAEVSEFVASERGEAGFGSSGVK